MWAKIKLILTIGVMEEAIMYYRNASDEMTEFLQEQAVEHWNIK
jgi:hypothetical protein